jgi:hypothetical protein
MRNLVIAVAVFGFAAALVGGTLSSQACVPCIAVFVALAGGYFGARLARPETQALAGRGGAKVGAIGGLSAFVGHLAGGLVVALGLGPLDIVELGRSLGLDLSAGAASTATSFNTTVGAAAFCGVVEVALMAGAGAVGAIIWYQQQRGQRPLPPAIGQ